MRIRDLAAGPARALPDDALLKTEGAGKTGCALHPRSRVHVHEEMRTRAYRSSGEHPAFPAQWLYGLWRALPGDEFVFVTVAAGFTAHRSGWIKIATDNLASATDARTTRFCRTQQPNSPDHLRPKPDFGASRKASSGNTSFVCAPVVRSRSPRGSPCDSIRAPTLPRPPHLHPRS